MIETVFQDVRYALRALRHQPTFAAVVVFTLAIGIGATTAIFTVVNAVLLRPLPYPAPNRLVEVTETNPLRGWTHATVAPANFADWQRMNTVFEGLAAYRGTNDDGLSGVDVFFTGGAEPQSVKAIVVTGNIFKVLGVAPFIGRWFNDAETFQSADRPVVLSYGMWRSLLAADEHVVGTPISLNGRDYTVVGVMPPGFFFPGRDVQLWMPLSVATNFFVQYRRPHSLRVIARLRPGVTLDGARFQMTSIARELERLYPDTNTQMGVRLEDLHSIMTSSSRPALLTLFGAVGVLFMTVCANVASLQLGRAAGRSRELAIRRAVGASFGRIARQLLTEALVVSVIGGACGLALASLVRSTSVFWPTAVPVFAEVRVDRGVVFVAIGLSMLAPVLFALLPALATSGPGELSSRSESSSRVVGVIRDLLVTSEVALSIVLVVGALLLGRSLVRLGQVDPGFNAEHVVTFKVNLPNARYTDAQRVLVFDEVERRLRTIPGVLSVGATSTLTLRGHTWTGDATVEGRGVDDFERELRHKSVTVDYFRSMGIRLLAGRLLTERDKQDPHVTLVNDALVKQYFRGADPIQKRIKFGRPLDNDPWMTIVGVVADTKQDGMDRPVGPEVYVTMNQNPQNPLTYVVRSGLDVDTLITAVRRHVHDVDKGVVPTDIATLTDVVTDSIGSERFRTTLLGGFAVVALFLAALGVYGMLAYFVTQRSRELGIRLALGAKPAALFRVVVAQAMRPMLAGMTIGLLVAIGVTGALRSLLFGVTPLDPATYGAAAGILAFTALAACALPAARATRVDPLVSLREE